MSPTTLLAYVRIISFWPNELGLITQPSAVGPRAPIAGGYWPGKVCEKRVQSGVRPVKAWITRPAPMRRNSVAIWPVDRAILDPRRVSS